MIDQMIRSNVRWLDRLPDDADPWTIWAAIGINYIVDYPDGDRPPLFGKKGIGNALPNVAKRALAIISDTSKRDSEALIDGVASWMVEVAFSNPENATIIFENAVEDLLNGPKEGEST